MKVRKFEESVKGGRCHRPGNRGVTYLVESASNDHYGA